MTGGGIVQDGTVQLIQGRFEVIENLPQVDLVIMDPPDNIGRKYEGYEDRLPEDEYGAKVSLWLAKACRLSRGPVFLTFNERWIPLVEDVIRQQNINLVQRLWWRWTFGQNQSRRYVPSLRPLYWLHDDTIYPGPIKVPSARAAKYKDKRAKPGGRLPDNVWEFSRVCGTFKERRRWHDNQIPEKLVRRIVLGHSSADDIVLDPFIGSGTTAYVCHDLDRKIIGIDVSAYYVSQIQLELDKRQRQRHGNTYKPGES